MDFISAFKEAANNTTSENGGLVKTSTLGGSLLDLFAKIGGMRNRDSRDIVSDWLTARQENEELADNLILYTRDIRNAGIGERRIARILLKELAKINPTKVKRNFQTIVNVGRWDDLFTFIDTPVEKEMFSFIKEQLYADMEGLIKGFPISNCAKWLKSSNTSSEESRKIAKKTYTAWGFSERQYRKILSDLRRYIRVTEKLMSDNNWEDIKFSAVPALAMSRYIKAFDKHCNERFTEYKENLVNGKEKVNAATLYPYDIVLKFFKDRILDVVSEQQWKSLPNYVNENYDVVVMADVSGSMTCDGYKPIATSVGLATYFAQHNKGAYHNLYMTFTDNPYFIAIKDEWPLYTTLKKICQKGIGYNTNLDRAMKAIYEMVLKTNQAPKALVIISDGEFDSYNTEECNSIIDKWNTRLKNLNFGPIKVISWNVANRNDTYIGTINDNISYISGYGIGSFKHLTDLINNDAYNAMVKILSLPQFQWK